MIESSNKEQTEWMIIQLEIEAIQDDIEDIRKVWNKDKKHPYQWPARYETPRPEIAVALRELRRSYVNDRTEFLTFGKLFKRLSAHYLRMERACNLMLPWFEGKGVPLRPETWPIELAYELDLVSIHIELLD